MFLNLFNPFLFTRGLSCPSSFQTSLAQNCLELTISGFPYNFLPVSCGDNGFLKNRRTSICVEIRPQSAFIAFRVLLPSANNSADWSGRVWQPSADNNGHLTLFFSNFEACQTAITICRGLSRPTQEVQKKKPWTKYAKWPLQSAEGCHTQLEGQNCPLRT